MFFDEIEFYEDPGTGEPHIYNHGVDEDEVIDVLENRADSYQEDMKGRNNSRIRHGQTESGRYLRIVYSPLLSRKGIFIVTAYDLRGKALSTFRRQRKKNR